MTVGISSLMLQCLSPGVGKASLSTEDNLVGGVWESLGVKRSSAGVKVAGVRLSELDDWKIGVS